MNTDNTTPTNLTLTLDRILSDCREIIALGEKATPGPWRWQGEDYRGDWGWQLLVNSTGDGVACGESPKGPYKELRAYMPIESKFCKTGFEADKDSAPCLHIREPDAAFIARSRTIGPAAAQATITAIEGLMEVMMLAPEIYDGRSYEAQPRRAAERTLTQICASWPKEKV